MEEGLPRLEVLDGQRDLALMGPHQGHQPRLERRLTGARRGAEREPEEDGAGPFAGAEAGTGHHVRHARWLPGESSSTRGILPGLPAESTRLSEGLFGVDEPCRAALVRQESGPRIAGEWSGLGRGRSCGPTGPSGIPSHWWAFTPRRTWSARRMARRPSSPLTFGRARVRTAATKLSSSRASGSRPSGWTWSTRRILPEEALLHGERLGQVEPVQVDLAASEAVRGADQRPRPGAEVERRVPLGAPEPHLADGLEAHPAGRQVGHAAVLELDPGVGDVLVAAEDAHARPPPPTGPASRRASRPGRGRGSSGRAPRRCRSSGRCGSRAARRRCTWGGARAPRAPRGRG